MLQKVYFSSHHRAPCLYLCTNCTHPQVIKWKTVCAPKELTSEFVVALPGEIDTMSIRTTKKQTLTLLLRWPETQSLAKKEPHQIANIRHTTRLIDILEATWLFEPWVVDIFGFANFPQYRKYPKSKQLSGGMYIFVKYTSKTGASKTFAERTGSVLLNYYQAILTLPDNITLVKGSPDPCPMDTKHPKQFSWKDALQLCTSIGSTLPEFISRKDQEEFVSLLKSSTDIYPTEAIFIGASRSPKSQVCVSSESLLTSNNFLHCFNS